MRIVFTSYSSSPEYHEPVPWLKRIEGYTIILESLAKKNEVIGIERIDYEGRLQQSGVDYYFSRQKKKVVRFPKTIHELINKLQPDVVFINGILFSLQLIQLRRILGKGIRIVVIHRSERAPRGLKRILVKRADKHVDAYLFSSLEFGNEWKGLIDTGKIRELPMATSTFHPIDKRNAIEFTKVTGSVVYLWVGSLISRKDPLTAVKAFLEFAHLQPGVKLYMIYESSQLLDEIKKVLEHYPSEREAIVWVGAVPHEELLYWFNAADFFIAASLYEGIGVALMEAMSCGCIPIVSGIPSFRKMTGPGACGLVFRPGSNEDLLLSLLQSIKMEREKEKKLVLDQFKKELSCEAISEKINQLLCLS